MDRESLEEKIENKEKEISELKELLDAHITSYEYVLKEYIILSKKEGFSTNLPFEELIMVDEEE